MKNKCKSYKGNDHHSDETDEATQDSFFNDHTFRWTPESTKLMLDLRFERQDLFQQRVHQKKKLWGGIAEEMVQQGYFHVTSDMCDLKYRNMLQTYKKNRLKDELGLRSTIVWDYYDLFKNAFREMEEEEEATVPSMMCELMCDAATAEALEKCTDDKALNPIAKRELVKLEDAQIDEKDVPTIYNKYRSFPPRRSMRVSKRPRRFSTLSPPLTKVEPAADDGDDADADAAQPYIAQFDKELGEPRDTSTPSATTTTTTTAAAAAAAALTTDTQENLTPTWLTASEFQEYKIFGESIGLQLAQVKELKSRALLQLKIQELLYKAKIGRLTME